MAKCSLADFAQAFIQWLQQTIRSDTPLAIAVDGKTSCRGLDPHGQPLHMLTALVHDFKPVVGQ